MHIISIRNHRLVVLWAVLPFCLMGCGEVWRDGITYEMGKKQRQKRERKQQEHHRSVNEGSGGVGDGNRERREVPVPHTNGPIQFCILQLLHGKGIEEEECERIFDLLKMCLKGRNMDPNVPIVLPGEGVERDSTLEIPIYFAAVNKSPYSLRITQLLAAHPKIQINFPFFFKHSHRWLPENLFVMSYCTGYLNLHL